MSVTPTQNKNKRLAAYSQQAKHFKAGAANVKKYAALLASPLAALPFAAMGQCGTATVVGNGTAGSPIQVDLDGGGADFSFFYNSASSIGVVPLNQTVFSIATSLGYPAYLNSGALSLLSFVPNPTGGTALNQFGFGNWPDGNTGGSGFIGVRTGSTFGFIQLTIGVGTGISVDPMETGLAFMPNIGFVGICASLPVELTSFTAKVLESNVALAWETATEENNAGFEVQRSTDGDKFEKIAWVEGNGSTVEAQSYAFVDKDVAVNKTYYYRLKQVDLDGSFEYSDIVKANVVKKGSLSVGEVFPNPVQNESMLTIDVAETTEAVVSIFESTGKLLTTYQTELQSGTNQLNLAMEDYAAGVYFVKIQANGEQVYRKVSKQ